MSAGTEERINVKCQHCGKLLKAPPSWIGKSLKCPGCSKTFTAARSAAAAPMMPPSTKPTFNFVEDRRGKAEVKAFFMGAGLMLAGAALSIILWYALGSSLKKEVNWFAFPAALLIGGGTFLGYKRADVTMGMLAACACFGVIVFSRYLVYGAMANTITDGLTVTEFTGPKAVAFQEAYDEQNDKLPDYTDEQDPDGEKAAADIAKLRARIAKDVEKMSDTEVRQKILDADAKYMDRALYHDEYVKAINENGYAPDTAPASASEGASRLAEERIAKIPVAEKKKKYLDARRKELLESLPHDMAQLQESKDAAANPSAADEEENDRPRGRLERMFNVREPSAQHIDGFKPVVQKMSVEEMIVQDKVVNAEQFQLSLNSAKETGTKLVTGLSFLSPKIALLTLSAMGLAFTVATGGKFKD